MGEPYHTNPGRVAYNVAFGNLGSMRKQGIINYAGDTYDHLAFLLGYRSYVEMAATMSVFHEGAAQQAVQTCYMLCGPHGLTVYKMLMAKRSDNNG